MDIVRMMMAIVMLTSKLSQQVPRLVKDSVEFYDRFNEKTSLAYDRGYVLVQCLPGLGEMCDENMILIGPDGASVHSKLVCENGKSGEATLRLDINDKTKLGSYHCQYKNNKKSDDALNIDYRLCSDHSTDCQATTKCAKSESFCIVGLVGNEEKVLPCAKTVTTGCQTHVTGTHLFCPAETMSLCLAIATDYSKAWAEMAKVTCPTDGGYIPRRRDINQKSVNYLYNDFIQMDETNKQIFINVGFDPTLVGPRLHEEITA